MMTQNGVILTASGNLLRAGNCDFSADGSFDGGTETYKTDVPFPNKVVEEQGEANVTHWTGAVWDEVAQP